MMLENKDVICHRIHRKEAIRFLSEVDWNKVGSSPLQKAIQSLVDYYTARGRCVSVVRDDKKLDVNQDICAWHLLELCQEDEPII